MYDEAGPSEAESAATDSKDVKSDETEDKLALVQSSFFKEQPKPGMREMVEVVQVYENEVSIKCVYSDDDDDEEKAEAPDDSSAPTESEDPMMS